jgi:hypothetical protein
MGVCRSAVKLPGHGPERTVRRCLDPASGLAAIQGQGLTAQSYNTIAQVAQGSPELRDRIIAMIKEIR